MTCKNFHVQITEDCQCKKMLQPLIRQDFSIAYCRMRCTYLALANFEFGSCGSFGCIVPVLYIAHYSCLVNGACVQRNYSSLQQSIWVCVHWWTNIDLSIIDIDLLITGIALINNEFWGKHLVIFTVTSTVIYKQIQEQKNLSNKPI